MEIPLFMSVMQWFEDDINITIMYAIYILA